MSLGKAFYSHEEFLTTSQQGKPFLKYLPRHALGNKAIQSLPDNLHGCSLMDCLVVMLVIRNGICIWEGLGGSAETMSTT